jgi:DNA primase
MRWPRSFTEELRTQADIVRIVGDYVALKKRGTNWQACCPFHQEKTPSFNVNPARQLFKCFGCGKAGDVFRFVMEIEGISFPDAIRTVAEKCGVPLPEVAESQESEERDRLREDLLRMNAWATEFFDIQLRETDEGRRALTYLEARGIEPGTQRQFRLGYAPASWDGLTNYLRERGASKTQIERSGLVTLRDSGTGFYDRFRGRLMFPISDAQGRIVAFGGRIIGEGEPKYLNSPETTLYTKGQHLFGLSESRDEIRRRGYAILVEGYLDFLIPYQAGVKHLVASLGTALTDQQVRLLGRYTRKIIVNFDPDSAGVNATKRSLETLLNEGFKVNVLTLPDNLDPDEFIRDRGPAEYVKLLKGTQSFLDYIVEQAIRGHDQTTPTGKVETINAILPYLKLVKERIERAEHIERIADRLKIEGRLIREEFKRAVESRQEKVSPRVSMAMTAIKPAERRLLEVLLNQSAVRRRLMNEMLEEDYSGLRTAELFRLIFDFERRGEEPNFSTLSEALGDEELAQNLLPSILVGDSTNETSQEELLLSEAIGTLFNLRCGQIEEQRKALRFEINEAYRTNDDLRVDELSMQVARLAQRERELSRWSADTAIANTGNK